MTRDQSGLTTGFLMMGLTTGGGGALDGARRAAWSGVAKAMNPRRTTETIALFMPKVSILHPAEQSKEHSLTCIFCIISFNFAADSSVGCVG